VSLALAVNGVVAGLTQSNPFQGTTNGFYFAVLSIHHEWARWVTLALGLWLFAFTAFISSSNPATFWNDAMVALAIFILSLVGGTRKRVVGMPAA